LVIENGVRAEAAPHLERALRLPQALALNMAEMVGIGPFITIPLLVAAAGGPQAMLGWIFGAVLALCDGLVWAELASTFPGTGGSYLYLKEIFEKRKTGRLLSFLYVWQLSFSAPLSIATGCVGLAAYLSYIWPGLKTVHARLPGAEIAGTTLLAMAFCAFAVFLLYRRTKAVGRISEWLWLGVLVTLVWVIFAGLTHFSAKMAFDFPPGAFQLGKPFFLGLGGAMLIATYDYWGYYCVCFLGDEVEEPTRTIPRAILISIAIIAALYLVMNISILGVVPWRELQEKANTSGQYVIATMMERIYGHTAAVVAAVLIAWTAFASLLSVILQTSRVPYAAAQDGNYFPQFGHLHEKGHFPDVSLIATGAVACVFCIFRLGQLVAALVVIRIVMQFVLQTIGLLLLRSRRPQEPRPFRMWLYPAPAVIALAGFVYILVARKEAYNQLALTAAVIVTGLAIYLIRAWRARQWPFPEAARDV
jgi:APA family basic amino acid/polyamine antiporter